MKNTISPGELLHQLLFCVNDRNLFEYSVEEHQMPELLSFYYFTTDQKKKLQNPGHPNKGYDNLL